ncbi:energy transducer TonB [Chromobacterium vaccinii]|uniref:energy transducer TonB n=2 Tax=Chromobacterium vaccinii TaxID=1108595 RepID=UPI001E380DDB|nr:energy transducer TonB [Chromobacterium vaccinii]MCD4500269.1 TonB family protein [Chromobacterium vaccinii]
MAAAERKPRPVVGWGGGALLLALAPLLWVWICLPAASEAEPPSAQPAVVQLVALQARAPTPQADKPVAQQRQMASAESRARAGERAPVKLARNDEARQSVALQARRDGAPSEADADSASRPARSAESASSAKAPQRADDTAAAQNSDGNARNVDWEGRVLGHLAAHKRYPEDAISRRRGGVAKVDVTLDAGGRVKSASLVAGSGTLSLDREALAVLRRAQPLPAPPPERLVAGQIRIVLPIHFDLNQAG